MIEYGNLHSLYSMVDLAVLALPLLLSFDKKVAFFKEWKYFLPVNLAVGAFFIAWDVWFTKVGVWAFNSDYLLGPTCFGLPIEECLFFFCIPYASVFTYFALRAYVKRNPLQNADSTLNIAGIIVCLLLVLNFSDRWYIAITSLITSSAFFGLPANSSVGPPIYGWPCLFCCFRRFYPMVYSRGWISGIIRHSTQMPQSSVIKSSGTTRDTTRAGGFSPCLWMTSFTDFCSSVCMSPALKH